MLIVLRVGAFLGVWVGSALVLSEFRWFARVPLAERLRSYALSQTPVADDAEAWLRKQDSG